MMISMMILLLLLLLSVTINIHQYFKHIDFIYSLIENFKDFVNHCDHYKDELLSPGYFRNVRVYYYNCIRFIQKYERII